MQAILYICHGSRLQVATDEAVDFVDRTMKLVDADVQEYCFLELAEPSISEGVRRCVERGATKIAVVPVLLLTAAHAKKDIPELLEVEKKKYSQIDFVYGNPLGVHERMVDVLVERIEEKTFVTEDTEILLVGRGSSDLDAVEDTQRIADLLEARLHGSSVRKCFLAAAEPKFEQALQAKVEAGARHVVIMPYLLFTGILMTGIEQTVSDLNLNLDQKVNICDYLGNHQNVCELLKIRAEETIREGKSHATMA